MKKRMYLDAVIKRLYLKALNNRLYFNDLNKRAIKCITPVFFSLCLLMLAGGCGKSVDPGNWTVTPYKPEPKPKEVIEKASRNFKVMSINMNLRNNVAGFEAMKNYIKEYDPDFVFLRQVDSATTRSNKIDRPGEIAKALGMKGFFKNNMDYQTGGFGNAVFSKFPIKSEFSKLLNRTPSEAAERRSFVMLKVEVEPGKEVYFAGTELDPSKVEDRKLQVADITAITDGIDMPLVFVGNLNEQEAAKGPVLEALKRSFSFGCLGEGCIWNAPKAKPNGVYDYIMFKDKSRNLSLVSYGTFPKSENTFLPMVAEFKLDLKNEKK